jgi:oligopeptide/dipeptide ABC transporter ATP-binding protein
MRDNGSRRTALADESARSPGGATPRAARPLLEIEDLFVTYRSRHGARRGGQRGVVAIDGVDLDIWPGESLGVVGESGSGKSTLARTVVGLVPPTAGHIRYDGAELTGANRARLREFRREIQMVFQDPYGSVNPRSTIRSVVAEPLENYHRNWNRARRDARVTELLTRVRLPAYIRDFPVAGLSGGQLQRVGIARALALGPRLLVADEPVSALDVSIQARILNLLSDLKQSEGISLLFITHNLAVAQFIADRIAVVYAGRVMEVGEANAVIESPRHPYTKELLAAIPGSRVKASSAVDRTGIAPPVGEVGCPFRVRCPLAAEICATSTPPLEEKIQGHRVACHMVTASTRSGQGVVVRGDASMAATRGASASVNRQTGAPRR